MSDLSAIEDIFFLILYVTIKLKAQSLRYYNAIY